MGLFGSSKIKIAPSVSLLNLNTKVIITYWKYELYIIN